MGLPNKFSRKGRRVANCGSCCALNKQTVEDHYPYPHISGLFEQLASASVFTSLELAQGYRQTCISKEYAPKTTFKTPFAHEQSKVSCFQLTNAPTFQGVMNPVCISSSGSLCWCILMISHFSQRMRQHSWGMHSICPYGPMWVHQRGTNCA